jgi:filamentous hemagglutinin
MPEIAKSIEKMDLPNAVKQGLAQVAAAVVGAAVGGAAGVAGAVHVEANNRQLHESEKVLAKRLAEQSKGKYTQVQIEEQMRGMTMKQNGVTEYGVYDTVVGGVPSDTDGAWLLSGITDGKPIYTQYMEPEDAVLRAYIVRNTTGSSVPSLITYEGPYEAPDAPVYSNTTGPLPTAKCAVTAADCAAGIAPPLTAEQKMENMADFSRKISLTAGMIASAAAISGNEHLAAIFASISTGAGGIEYLVTRDERAVYIQKTIDVLTDKVIEKQPSLFLAREILKEALSQYWSQNEKK